MNKQLIAIDPSALDSLRMEIVRLHRRLDGVTMAPRPEWVTVAEYAEKVGRTKRTVRNWIDAGTVDTKVEGKVLLVRITQGV